MAKDIGLKNRKHFSQELQRALNERLGLTANMLEDTVTKLEEQTTTLD